MWYVTRTELGQEELLRQQVRDGMFGEHLNTCKVLYCACKKRYLGTWHEALEVFMPGYLFWAMDDLSCGCKTSYEVMETTEVIRNDGLFGGKEMWFIGREEEEFLKRITGGKEEIGMSYGVIQNGVLKISKGAMIGMEDRIIKIDRHKRKGFIKLRLDDEEKVAKIGLEITEKTYSMGNMFGETKN